MDVVSDMAPSVFVFRETNGDPRRIQHLSGSYREGVRGSSGQRRVRGERWSAEGEGAAVVSGG